MKTLNLSRQKKYQSAFTLIEIMVATVVMIVLTGLVIQITSEVLKVWNRSSGKLATNAEARIAMDLLTQDLEAAVFRNNDLQWLRSEKDSTSLGTNTVALRLFAPALDRPEGPGDICAIAYQLENRDPVSGSASQGDPDDRLWILYRMVASPEDTFDNLMGVGNQDALPAKNKPAWNSNSIVGSNGSNYLVRNVVNFEVDFHVQDDGISSTETLVTDADGTIYGGQSSTVGPQAQPLAYRQPLAYAEIRLTIVSDVGAQLLQNITKIPETEEEVIRQHGEVFTRRVNLLARPL
jgi:type II secretory pathway pseudopilin PulG